MKSEKGPTYELDWSVIADANENALRLMKDAIGCTCPGWRDSRHCPCHGE